MLLRCDQTSTVRLPHQGYARAIRCVPFQKCLRGSTDSVYFIGPIIRITPREISVSDPEFLDAIYAPGQGLRRDKDLEKVKALGINTSVGGAVQHDLHRRRREALNPYFSQKSVLNISPQIVDKASHLGRTFLAASEDGHVINLSDIYFAFASEYDTHYINLSCSSFSLLFCSIVSQYSFGHNANVLQNLRRASEMRNNVAKVLRGVKFNLNFSWVRALMRKLPPSIGARFTPQGIRDMIQFRMVKLMLLSFVILPISLIYAENSKRNTANSR